MTRLEAYWALARETLLERLQSGPEGLSRAEAETRLQSIGPNRLQSRQPFSRARVIAAQLRNPLLLILVFAAAASVATGELVDAAIVLAIVVASVGISYSREYSAQAAVTALQAQVRTRTTVVRDGKSVTAPVEDIVPGDLVVLSAGSLIPGDGVVLAAADFS